MSKTFRGFISELSEKSGYSYDFLTDIWNVAKILDNNYWLVNFDIFTLSKSWWNEFNFEIGNNAYVKDNEYELWDGVIDDLDEDNQALLILYTTDKDEKSRWVSFEEYVNTYYEAIE